MAAHATPVVGWIEIKPSPKGKDLVTITGHVQALEATTGQFKLAIVRGSKGNRANNSQGGKFDVDAGGSKALSSTTINIGPRDLISVELELLVEGKRVFVTNLNSSEPAPAKP